VTPTPEVARSRSRRRCVCAEASLVAIGLLTLVAGGVASAIEYEWDLPRGFPPPRVPEDNPMTIEKIVLGRLLFYDTRLSGNQTQACASCHRQEQAFTDGLDRAVGSTGEVHPRSSMTLTNVAYGPTLAWANPLLRDLETQALVPMFGEEPVELGLAGREGELLDRLAAHRRYQRLFVEAFPQDADPFTIANIVRAIGSFVRTLISGNTSYDRFVFGTGTLSSSAINGGRLFFSERLECFHCHGGFNFTGSIVFEGQRFDEILFENTGLYNLDGAGAYPIPNRGLFEITRKPEDMGRFKPPTLRNIELTAPYMHDGSIATLEDVLDHYAAGGRTIHQDPFAGVGSENPYKSIFVVGFRLSEQERADVIDFLKSLTDLEFVSNPAFSDPFEPVTCPGDCDDSGSVTVEELVRGIQMALGGSPLALCLSFDPNADGEVDVVELVGGVRAALDGCA
jgi:cytochrome c peroxidase